MGWCPGAEALGLAWKGRRRRENLGQPVQELESREPEGGTARGIGPRKQIEDLVGATVDKVETIESEKRPGAIPDGVAP